jgi:Recombinase
MDTTTARKRRYRQRRRAAQLKAYEVWLPAALVDELKQPDESINALVARAMDALRQQAPEAMRPPPATAGLTSEQRKAALVARLRELKAQGLTLQAIANQLNAEGEPTLTHKGTWQKGTVGNLLAQV